MLTTYKWSKENNFPNLPFKEMRMILQEKYGINDNNARNIYPLLKNCQFIDYNKGETLETKKFFTKTGLAYVKALEMITLIEASEYAPKQKQLAIDKTNSILYSLIYEGISIWMKTPKVNYNEALRDCISFLVKFKKIDRKEFALLLFERAKTPDFLVTLEPSINAYRTGTEDIEVVVKVRDDSKGVGGSALAKRAENISYLTSYNYFTNLLQQAGLLTKIENYYCVVEKNIELLQNLTEV